MIQPHQRTSGRPCSICIHLRRTEIELKLASGAGQKSVAQQYRVGKYALHRHWHRHIDPARLARLLVGPVQQAALAARICEESGSVIDHLRVVRAGLFQQFDAALSVGDRQTGALLAGKLHENLRITGNITGELAQSALISNTTINNSVTAVFGSPRFLKFERALLDLATAHPELHPQVLAIVKLLDDEEEPVPRPQRPAIEHQEATSLGL